MEIIGLFRKYLWLYALSVTTVLFANAGDGVDSIYNYEDSFSEHYSYDFIGDQLSCLENEVPLNFNTRVSAFINYFAVKDRDYIRGVIREKDYFFPIFEYYLKKYDLPEELKYLSIVESGLNPRAISRAGAGGLWQFMPYTGRSYGLHQDFYIDQRFDPHKATDAACRYMKMLHNMFGDWELALAAYNSGPGNVRKAIRRSGYKKSFWDIYRYLPRETRSYVPQFVAILYVLNYAEDFNLTVDDSHYLMAYDTILVENFTNLEVLADEINVCYAEIDRLNPAIKRFALPQSIKKYPVNIPADRISALRANRDSILTRASLTGRRELEHLARNTPGSTYGRKRIVYKVRSGDVLGTIAESYHVRVSDIRKWNNLKGNLIRIEQRLDVWVLPGRHSKTTVARMPTDKTTSQRIPLLDLSAPGKIHYVQPGDTLWDISRMYNNLSVEKIKKLNNLKSNKIKPGQKLILD